MQTALVSLWDSGAPVGCGALGTQGSGNPACGGILSGNCRIAAFPNACHSILIRTPLSSDASLQQVHLLHHICFLINLFQCLLPLYPFLPSHDPALVSWPSWLILECSMARHPVNREPVRLEKTRQETRCARRSDGLTQGAGSARAGPVPHTGHQ